MLLDSTLNDSHALFDYSKSSSPAQVVPQALSADEMEIFTETGPADEQLKQHEPASLRSAPSSPSVSSDCFPDELGSPHHLALAQDSERPPGRSLLDISESFHQAAPGPTGTVNNVVIVVGVFFFSLVHITLNL